MPRSAGCVCKAPRLFAAARMLGCCAPRDALEPLLERLTVRRNYLLRIQRRGKRVAPDWRPVPDQRAPLVELTADDRARLQRDLRACSRWRLGLLRGALWGLTCGNCHLLWGALLLCLLGLVTAP